MQSLLTRRLGGAVYRLHVASRVVAGLVPATGCRNRDAASVWRRDVEDTRFLRRHLQRSGTKTSQPNRLIRKSLRARGYDYSAGGLYFMTICVHHMDTRFGSVAPAGVVLSEAGRCIDALWAGIPDRHPEVGLDAYVVMPNHIHGIVVLGTVLECKPPSRSVIVGQFTSLSTAAYGYGVRAGTYPPFDRSLWQRGFHDHIIRNDRSLEELRTYIDGNPARWLERNHRT